MCAYSKQELDKWENVSNPIGEACYICEEECIHNPTEGWDDIDEEYYP